MSEKILGEEIVNLALDMEDICKGCSSRGSKECGLCEGRLQTKLWKEGEE